MSPNYVDVSFLDIVTDLFDVRDYIENLNKRNMYNVWNDDDFEQLKNLLVLEDWYEIAIGRWWARANWGAPYDN